MEAILNFLRRIRLVHRRSSTLLKCVVLAAIVFSTVCLVALRVSIQQQRQKTEELRIQAAALEKRNERLKLYMSELNTVEGVRRVAMEQLGLVSPGTIFFQPEGFDPE